MPPDGLATPPPPHPIACVPSILRRHHARITWCWAGWGLPDGYSLALAIIPLHGEGRRGSRTRAGFAERAACGASPEPGRRVLDAGRVRRSLRRPRAKGALSYLARMRKVPRFPRLFTQARFSTQARTRAISSAGDASEYSRRAIAARPSV